MGGPWQAPDLSFLAAPPDWNLSELLGEPFADVRPRSPDGARAAFHVKRRVAPPGPASRLIPR